MINQDFAEYPEHRVGFFKMMRAIDASCFAALLELPPPQFKLFMDSIIWAIKHTMRDIAEIGLNCECTLESLDSGVDDHVVSGCRGFAKLLQD